MFFLYLVRYYSVSMHFNMRGKVCNTIHTIEISVAKGKRVISPLAKAFNFFLCLTTACDRRVCVLGPAWSSHSIRTAPCVLLMSIAWEKASPRCPQNVFLLRLSRQFNLLFVSLLKKSGFCRTECRCLFLCYGRWNFRSVSVYSLACIYHLKTSMLALFSYIYILIFLTR